MFRSCLFRLLAIPLAILLLLAGYEAVQVFRAKARTPAALASVASRPIKLADLSEKRRAMLLKVEDPGFYRHHGMDMSTPGAGWTTITQSLVKHLYFPNGFKPGFAKIEQSLIAWWVLDPAVSKDEQLEIFLNHSSFGADGRRDVIGFADAARTYYGKPFDQLGDHEYLSLVAMLKAPYALDPKRHPQENAQRTERIEALIAGRCAPAGWTDTDYPGCNLPPVSAPAEPDNSN